ncbi:hypothetical protein Nepgr_013847 [Nepenthes gracilis]|uniref:Disease resistance protein At4g27190-like leucine-rich repeats domain-containing protein n=1 Tax=Nepenthes gracilis TaxID=150966 RepID=A0AAD3SJX0_NEPGR|nr:hypothetical protein Nepgr_013847 [Nepenthes gracilis]
MQVALPAVKKIDISHVNRPKEIWDSHLDAGSFNKLETLKMSNVEKDTKVFSLDTIKQMRNIKELDLQHFQLAEELIERIGFYNDGVENSALLPQLKELNIFSFPLLKRIPWRELALQNLRYLKIHQVEGLTYLFPTSVSRSLVNLKELDVQDCQMMEEIIRGELGDTNTVEVNVVFPHLNILRLRGLPALRSLSSDNVTIEFPSIIRVDFYHNPIQMDLLQKLQHVKELILGECEALPDPFDLERHASAIPPGLGKLALSNISKLQMIPWKIFPIENLHHLTIFRINGLKFPFPASLGSKGFAQLEQIHIVKCKDIEQVLAQENTDDTSHNAASTTIVFPRVKFIGLYNLGSLRSFSSENYKDLVFLSLEQVLIRECPMMETFSYGSLSTPKLSKITIDSSAEEENLDLNMVIKKRYV